MPLYSCVLYMIGITIYDANMSSDYWGGKWHVCRRYITVGLCVCCFVCIYKNFIKQCILKNITEIIIQF